MKISTGILTLAVLLASMSCSAQPQSSQPSKIIGSNDLVVVSDDGANLPTALRPVAEAVGWISMGCTGTHIGDGIVVTAGHCLNGAVAYFPRVEGRLCNGITIKWSHRIGSEEASTSQCTQWISAEFSPNADFAFMLVDPPPPDSIPARLDARPIAGDRLTILGHPQGRPLEWSGFCDVIAAPEAEQGQAPSSDQFVYQCDTEPGSSGSAVIDARTNEVVGIHNGAGRQSENWNYGTALAATITSINR